MKTLNKTLLALVAGIAVTAGANAALYSTTTTGYAGQPYVGVKAGQFNVDPNTSDIDVDNQMAYGVYGGYQFDPSWGAEVEYMGSDKADYTDNNGTATTLDDTKGTYKTQTLGAYGTYKYNFANSPVYAKGKLGFAQTQIKVDGDKADDTGLAGGVGLGYNFAPNAAIEAEYNKLPSVEDVDADVWTIGAHMKF